MNPFRLFLFASAVMAGTLLFWMSFLAGPAPAVSASTGTRVPVLVELFTSEGCSSCPPADALLFELEKQPVENAEVIVLGEHVDYWNYIGWTDRFSSAQFSDRQSEYAGTFGLESVYTPQMVVDGEVEFNGTSERRARRAIAEAAARPKAAVTLRLEPVAGETERIKVQITTGSFPEGLKGRVRLFLAVTETGLETSVRRGENEGRMLRHTGVVRTLIPLGDVDPVKARPVEAVLRLDPQWVRKNLRVIAFLQLPPARRVIGAAAVRLP
jgi:hypothetical protein